jgi:hypothetical protein
VTSYPLPPDTRVAGAVAAADTSGPGSPGIVTVLDIADRVMSWLA